MDLEHRSRPEYLGAVHLFRGLLRLALICVLFYAGAGCIRRRIRVPSPPDSRIVFQAMVEDSDALSEGYPLGFVDEQAKSTQMYILSFDLHMVPLLPVQTSDGMLTLAVSCSSAGLRAVTRSGEMVIYPMDADSPFRRAWRVAPVPNTHLVVVVNQDTWRGHRDETYSIRLLDLDTRKEVQVLAVLEPDPNKEPAEVFPSIGTAAMYHTWLTYSRCSELACQLVILDTLTAEESVLLSREDGILATPAFSPDGQWIAYTASDGIYVISADSPGNTSARRVVAMTLSLEWRSLRVGDLKPAPAWSPDGRWLVYHRCIENCMEGHFKLSNFGIFKVNVETGEEIRLFRGGVYPYWRR